MYTLVLRRLLVLFQYSEARFIRQIDIILASYGPQAPAYLGPAKGAHGALGRCVLFYAGTYALIIIEKPLSSKLMMHLSGLTALKEPRSRSETRWPSVPYSRTSRHSHESPLF